MKIDIVVTWPNNCDYPLWREWLNKNRLDFGKVLVTFMNANAIDDYRKFLVEVMTPDKITFLANRPLLPGEDWRDVAVSTALSHTVSDWILFMEQDMIFPTQEEYTAIMKAISKHQDNFDVFGFREGERLHPAFMLVRKETLMLTTRSFAVVPNKHDHFYTFYEELQLKGARICELPELFQYHMAGLSHNLTLMRRGDEVTYKPFAFLDYLKRSLRVSVPLDDHYLDIVGEYILQNE